MDQDGPGWSRMDNRIVQNVRKNGACLTGGFTDWNVFRFLELRMFSRNLLVAALLGFAIGSKVLYTIRQTSSVLH